VPGGVPPGTGPAGAGNRITTGFVQQFLNRVIPIGCWGNEKKIIFPELKVNSNF
jgi:hypothetical protein